MKHVAAFALFLASSIAMTWPLARTLDRAVAYPGDPYINTWILDWDWYATFHSGTSLFNANIFYPTKDSLALSENLYGIALVLFPFRAAGVPPVAAHNIAMLLGFALCGFGAYLLLLVVSGNAAAGIVAGIFYAFVPFRFTHLSHVQHVWGGTLPLMLAALLWYERQPTWTRGALFAAAFLFNGLCNIHSMLFGAIAIAATVLIIRPRLIPLAVCSAVVALVLIIFLRPYFDVGLHRTWAETKAFSARPADWLVSNSVNPLYAFFRNPNINPERWLFPGVLSIAIGCVGLFAKSRQAILIAIAWIALGFVGSLGLHTAFHRFLFAHVPGFTAIRVPARWASISYVGLAMLVGNGAVLLASRRRWIHVLIGAAFLIELRSAPIRWYMAFTHERPVDAWMREMKPRAVFELPLIENGGYVLMLRATAHHRPIVNGVSGFIPPISQSLFDLARGWSDQLVPALKRAGVAHIVIHADPFDSRGREWLSRAIQRGDIGFVQRLDGGIFGDWIFGVGAPRRDSPLVNALLAEKPTFSDHTFGLLERPLPEETMRTGSIAIGWALSPFGIREVNLLLNNGGIRIPAQLEPYPALTREFPWYDATTRPRFTVRFDQRPRGVWDGTDIQTEIVDGRGKRTLLEDRWIAWR